MQLEASVDLPASAASKLGDLDIACALAKGAADAAFARLQHNKPGEVAKLTAVRAAETQRHTALLSLTSHVRQWHNGLPRGIALETVEPVKAPKTKDESWADAIERTRKDIYREQRDLASTRVAAPTKTEIIVAMRERINEEADKAAPTISMDDKKGFIVSFESKPVDAFALMCWLLPTKIASALESLIDERFDAKRSMTAEQKRARIIEIEQTIDTLERAEENLIMSAAAAGVVIERRSDASPAAVLGVRVIAQEKAQAA